MRVAWSEFSEFIAGGRRRLLSLAAIGLVAGVAQAGVLVLVVKVALTLAEPGSSRELSDLPVKLTGSDALWLAGGLVLTMVCANAWMAHEVARLSGEAMNSARIRMVDAFAGASWPAQSGQREGALQDATTSLALHVAEMAQAYPVAISSLMSLIALVAAAVVVDPVVMGLALIGGAALSLAVRPLSRLTRVRATRAAGANSSYAESVSQLSSMSMELRAFGVTAIAAATVQDQGSYAADAFRRARFSTRFGGTFFRDLSIACLVLAVGLLYWSGSTGIADVATVVLLIVRALSFATVWQTSVQQVNERRPYLQAVRERIAGLRASPERDGPRHITSFDEIQLRSVKYSYSESSCALDSVDLTIRRGEILGIVGQSGSGKSTLVQTLLRLRRPSSGEVLFDGTSYEEFSALSWTHLVSFVPQEPSLVEGTVLDNVIFWRQSVDRHSAVRALALAGVLDEIEQLPGGVDMRLGARGSGLSGGQKQRVAIARALADSPQLLVLDEPSSALDPVSERRLTATLRTLSGQVAVVMVSHREGILDVCDRVVRVARGRIAERS